VRTSIVVAGCEDIHSRGNREVRASTVAGEGYPPLAEYGNRQTRGQVTFDRTLSIALMASPGKTCSKTIGRKIVQHV